MSRAKIAKLAAVVADLKAKKKAALTVPLATEALQAAGFRVYPFADGLSVNEAPGLHEKLAELEARGIKPPLVAVIRSFAGMSDAEAVAASAAWGAGS